MKNRARKKSLLEIVAFCFLLCLGIVIFPFLREHSPDRSEQIFTIESEDILLSRLSQNAREITVKVISRDIWGSGFIICNQNEQYVVLTANHILSDSGVYQIETHDGEKYEAYPSSLVEAGEESAVDVAFLTFSSTSDNLHVANRGNTPELNSGEAVYAAGFSFEAAETNASDFVVTTGQIESITGQPFQNGYQIGYTNRVERGMSGGPLIDSQGLVIGMNGMDKYPLWGNPYIFRDGSSPLDSEIEEMRRLSWAIPIESVWQRYIESLIFRSGGISCTIPQMK